MKEGPSLVSVRPVGVEGVRGQRLARRGQSSVPPCTAGYCRYDCQRDPAIWVPRLQQGEAPAQPHAWHRQGRLGQQCPHSRAAVTAGVWLPAAA